MSTNHAEDGSGNDVDGDLQHADSMSISGEDHAALDNLTNALRKLHDKGQNTTGLPQTVNDSLWGEIKSDLRLSVYELAALKNHVCIVRSRGVLRRVENSTLYRMDTDSRIRASFSISNTVGFCQYNLNADLLVDPGTNTELKLPARKVLQLGLSPFGRQTRGTGSTNHSSANLHFSPVLVTATFDRGGVPEIIRNYLDVKCDKEEYDALVASGVPSGGAHNETSAEDPFETPNQPIGGAGSTGHGAITIQLTPVYHRPSHIRSQQAVIGMDGLKKLRLHVNCDELQLEVEEDELLEEEEAAS